MGQVEKSEMNALRQTDALKIHIFVLFSNLPQRDTRENRTTPSMVRRSDLFVVGRSSLGGFCPHAPWDEKTACEPNPLFDLQCKL